MMQALVIPPGEPPARKHNGKARETHPREMEILLRAAKTEGVDVKALEPTLGWFFLQHAMLTPERKERALTALPATGDYTLEEAKKVCLRLFADLHLHEARPHGRTQHRPDARRHVNTLADTISGSSTPAQEEETEATLEGEEEDDTTYLDVHEVIREELGCLAAELASSKTRLTAEEEERIEDAAAQLSNVSEALETVRDARRRVNPKALAVSPRRGGKGKGKGKCGKQSREDIAKRKAKSTCKACGQRGHWANGPECPKRGQSIQEVAFEEEIEDESHTVFTVDAANDIPNITADFSINIVGDLAQGVVDTAAARSVAGGAWTTHYLQQLDRLGLTSQVSKQAVDERFRFGDGQSVECYELITAPAVVANTALMISWRHLPGLNLSLLLGRDFLIENGAIVNIVAQTLKIEGERRCNEAKRDTSAWSSTPNASRPSSQPLFPRIRLASPRPHAV